MQPSPGADGGNIPPLDESHFRPAVERARRPVAVIGLLALDALMIAGLGFVLFMVAISGLSGGIGHPSPKGDAAWMLAITLVLLVLHLVLWIGLVQRFGWVLGVHLLATSGLIVGAWVRPLGRDWPAAIPHVLGALTLALLLLPSTVRWLRSYEA
tara:strand:- start:6127 stop:6591 length:465 start_codon:yes stop_codon:yes gene_type:complete